MLGDLFYSTLHKTGITTLARHLRQGALVLCYHNVVPNSAGPHTAAFGDRALHLPLDRFTAQVVWLKDHYLVVPLHDLVARLESGRPVRGLAAITFDDGYTGALTLAVPVLRKLGLPATLFIVADAPSQEVVFWWDHPAIARSNAGSAGARQYRLVALGGDRDRILRETSAGITAAPPPPSHLPAEWSVVQQAAHSGGIELGAHTLTHRTMTTLRDAELRHEIQASRDIIEERTGVRPESFSYPYGIWDARVRDAVRRMGYRAAVTLEFGLNTPGIDPCALRRVNVPSSISLPAFAGWAAGVRPRAATAA